MSLVVLSACSAGSGDGAPETSSAPSVSEQECADLARAAAAPLQDFVDEYDVLMVAEWNAIDPPPDVAPARDAVAANVRAAIAQGCEPMAVEAGVEAAIGDLESTGEVGAAIVDALNGVDPTGEPVAQERGTVPTTVTVRPGDDLNEILPTVAEGSTLELAAGTHEYDTPIVVDVGVRFVGADRATTTIRSSAEGAGLVFLGSGGLAVEDLTIEHIGESPASVMLAIAGPLTVDGVELRGAVAGDTDAGGGHGLVLAFESLPGFPDLTPEERAGDLVIDDSSFVDNAAAGVLVRGDAEPSISGARVTGNGQCGICYGGRSGGTVDASTIEENPIGIQAADDVSLSVADSTILGNSEVGVSVEGAADVEVVRTDITRNGEIGAQVSGTSTTRFSENVIDEQAVGVLATGDVDLVLIGNVIANGEVGLQVDGRVVLDVHDNRIWASELTGIGTSGDTTGVVRDNLVEGARVAGIQVAGEASLRVASNSISGPGDVGISFAESSGGSVDANTVTGRTVGIQVAGSAAPDVTGNIIVDSGVVGLLYIDEASGIATGNDISGAGEASVLLGGTGVPDVGDNELNGGRVVVQPLDE